MVTPFHKDGSLDENTLRDLVEGQVVAGVAGVLACGTTGESPTLSYEEHNQVIEITIKQVNNRCQVMAGTGSNSTKEAICLTEHAKKIRCNIIVASNSILQ
jgi:4-hydroxy-tetrahydrodipicolinate synthase